MSIEAEKQEPVAWRFRIKNHMYQKDKWHLRPHKVIDPNAEVQPLYTAPPQREWVGLTDEDIYSMIESNVPPKLTSLFEIAEWVAKVVEARLKEKNNA